MRLLQKLFNKVFFMAQDLQINATMKARITFFRPRPTSHLFKILFFFSALVAFYFGFYVPSLYANGELTGESINNDPIMLESLERQGMGYALQKEMAQPQRQEENIKQENVEQEQEIKTLNKKILALQRQVDELKKQNQQPPKNEQAREVVKVSMDPNLKAVKAEGRIGKFSVSQGDATAKVIAANGELSLREMPALKVCATMADANKLSKADFLFLGLGDEVSDKIIQRRGLQEGFKSSDEIKSLVMEQNRTKEKSKIWDQVKESIFVLQLTPASGSATKELAE